MASLSCVSNSSDHSMKTVRPIYPFNEGVTGIAMEGEGGTGGELGEVLEEIEEAVARNPKVARKPNAPTKAMVLAREVHHADYREWCDHCVAGKGVCHKHRSSERDDP